MSSIAGFVIITAAGKLQKPQRGAARVYLARGPAIKAARHDGESVLSIDIDLERNPVFIRSKKL